MTWMPSERSWRSKMKTFSFRRSFGVASRCVPVGQDDAAEWIGAGQRHKGHRIQRRAPQIRIDADGASISRLVLAAEEGDAAFSENAVRLAVNIVLAAGGFFLARAGRVFGFAPQVGIEVDAAASGEKGNGKQGNKGIFYGNHVNLYLLEKAVYSVA